MSIKTILVGATAAGIALGSFGLAANEASAAVLVKKPVHHALVCKAGFARHHVRVHGKRIWECVKIRAPMHKPIVKKP